MRTRVIKLSSSCLSIYCMTVYQLSDVKTVHCHLFRRELISEREVHLLREQPCHRHAWWDTPVTTGSAERSRVSCLWNKKLAREYTVVVTGQCIIIGPEDITPIRLLYMYKVPVRNSCFQVTKLLLLKLDRYILTYENEEIKRFSTKSGERNSRPACYSVSGLAYPPPVQLLLADSSLPSHRLGSLELPRW